MAPTITLYDFPSSHLKDAPWNPNVFKARIALAYKGIPFDVKHVEYPDIEGVIKPLGGVATSKKADGTVQYTLPAIVDHGNADKCVVDSLEIARYLDARFPDTPKLLTVTGKENLEGVVALVQAQLMQCMGKIFGVMMAKSCVLLNPPSESYFRRTRAPVFGDPLENLLPAAGAQDPATWGAFVEALDAFAASYPGFGSHEKGLWILGPHFTYADAPPLAFLAWVRTVCGPASAEWARVAAAGGGLWARQLAEADQRGWFGA